MQLELTLPSSISEIPLVNYQKFLKVQENSNDEEFIVQKMIEIFCGIQLKDVVKIKYTELQGLLEHFQKIFSVKPNFYQTWKYKEMEFGFIPNLENITWGEYIDLEHHLNNWDDYHKAIAVMYRPIIKREKERYQIAPYTASEEFHEFMKFIPMEIAISARVFFYNLGAELLRSTSNYLETMKMMNRKERRVLMKGSNLINNGGGIQAFTQLLTEMSDDLMKLQTYNYINVSLSLPSKSKKTKSKKSNLNEI